VNTNLTFLQARESPTSSLFGSHEVPRRSRRARGTLRRHRRREKEEAAKMLRQVCTKKTFSSLCRESSRRHLRSRRFKLRRPEKWSVQQTKQSNFIIIFQKYLLPQRASFF